VRFFRCDGGDDVYEQTRLSLDAAWGHPNAGIVTCIDPANVAPRDQKGRILLGVNDEFCGWQPASAMLAQLLASGAVTEITAGQYRDSLPQAQ
jgi:hypothetical protein